MTKQGDDAAGPSALAHANLKRKVKERDQNNVARSCLCGFVASFLEGYRLGDSKLHSCPFLSFQKPVDLVAQVYFAKAERFLWFAVAGYYWQSNLDGN